MARMIARTTVISAVVAVSAGLFVVTGATGASVAAGASVTAGTAVANGPDGSHARPGGLGQGHGIGGHKSVLQNATSTNWAGWVNTGGVYTSVSASWRQPAVTCAARETSYSSMWVGLDGDGSSTVEQAGTEADCVNGRASYSAWYEFYPAYPVYFGDTVRPGDRLTASVVYTEATKEYTTTVKNSSRGWVRTATGTVDGAANASAEVIVEAPGDAATGAVLPLANFATIAVNAATVNGARLGAEPTPSSLAMVTASGLTKAATSPLTANAGFTITWVSSGVTPPARGRWSR